MFKTKKWTLVSAVAGAAVFTLAIAGVWMFGGPTVVSAAEGIASTVLEHRGGPGGWFKGGDVDHEQLLADELGVTVEELEAARESVQESALAHAIEEGRITQEEVDEMQARKALQESLKPYIDRDTLMAEALGMTLEDLQVALDAGTSMSDLLSEQGLDQATYRENMTAAHEAALAQAVEDGVITQEQADEMPSGPQGSRGRGMMLGGDKPAGRMMPGGDGENFRGRGGRVPSGQEGDGIDGTRFSRPNRTPAVEGNDA